MLPGPSKRRAFSLVELLLSIGGVAILLLISLPAIRTMRERGASARCVGNLKQIGMATVSYLTDHRNEFPYCHYITDAGGHGSGAYTGTWYYNLAGYLGVPHTELSHNGINEERVKLGTKTQRLSEPCVFTCPGHRPTESKMLWKPAPMTWPAEKPVSYAPPLEARGNASPRGIQNGPVRHASGIMYYPLYFSDILYPSRKIWIADSGRGDILNTSDSRWKPGEESWAYQGFTRHNQGGNALFYDGHVEWLALKTFTEPENGSIGKTSKLYFSPFRTPDQDR
ncbi:MAG TPA: prepilin-type N-terminal cleavage/methylation domain-containing protein [Chthoniobacteraceae bacterium]|nr:prepilin-type N-terminal cleavage/methylation domain-containing protein [Chthoniobacteraceae bacterium]